MSRLHVWVLALVCSVLGGVWGASAQGYRFTVRDDLPGGEGALLYQYHAGSLAVSELSHGGPPMLLETVTLTGEEREAVEALAEAAWAASLEGVYLNPAIRDGHHLTLALESAAGASRRFEVGNYHAPALASLCGAVNGALGGRHAIPYAAADDLPGLPVQPAIVAGVEPVFFATEVERINRGTSNIMAVLSKLERAAALSNREPERGREAADILDAVERWADAQYRAIDRQKDADLPGAYGLAQEAVRILGRHRYAGRFEAFMDAVRADREVLRGVEAELALRDAKSQAASIGLGEDVEDVEWNNRSRQVARDLGDKMDTIATVYRGTPAAREARETMARWRAQIRAIEARAPKWEYTWHIDLIVLGTEQRVRLSTDYRGERVTEIDTEIVYDLRKVVMHGTFQNTSSEPHRYTFVVGLSDGNEENNPFGRGGDLDELLGYERVQTPLLQPGELHEWSTEVTLRNIRHIRRGGLGVVVADQPDPREQRRQRDRRERPAE